MRVVLCNIRGKQESWIEGGKGDSLEEGFIPDGDKDQNQGREENQTERFHVGSSTDKSTEEGPDHRT